MLDDDAAAGIARLRRCVACPVVSPSAYRLLADAHGIAGDRTEARRVLLEGRARFPRSPYIFVALGRIERDLGHGAAAKAAFARAHALRPDDPMIESEWRRALAEFGTPDERAEAKIRPLIREANGRYELEDVEGARDTLETALERAGPHPRVIAEVLHRIALLELAEGRPKVALRRTRSAVSWEGVPAELLANLNLVRSEAFMTIGRWDLAEPASLRALELRPEDPRAAANLALVHHHLGRRAEALVAFRSAVDNGLPRILTFKQLVAVQQMKKMLDDPEFQAVAELGWPGAAAQER